PPAAALPRRPRRHAAHDGRPHELGADRAAAAGPAGGYLAALARTAGDRASARSSSRCANARKLAGMGSGSDRSGATAIEPAPRGRNPFDRTGTERGADGVARYLGRPASLVDLLRTS